MVNEEYYGMSSLLYHALSRMYFYQNINILDKQSSTRANIHKAK